MGYDVKKILEVKNLDVYLNTYDGRIHAVRDVSFDLEQGSTLVIVGESGCGKSMTARAVLDLLPAGISEKGQKSRILFRGRDIFSMSEKEKIKNLRGEKISMIFQDPSTFLNPTATVGRQISECLTLHRKISAEEVEERTLEILKKVRITDPERRMRQYPHELSGGMRQRVMIAIALICRPEILIADEPTTALDVTTQAEIMELIDDLKKEFGTSVILVTHDLGVAAEMADNVVVMYAGEVIEQGAADDIFSHCRHPYTRALFDSVPGLEGAGERRLYSLEGTPPDLSFHPDVCAFSPRCEYCMNVCRRKAPPLIDCGDGHLVSCYLMHPDAPKPERIFERSQQWRKKN